MARVTLASLALAAVAVVAQNATVSLVVPLDEQHELLGSVVSVGSDATTYAIMCPPGETGRECAILGTQTVIEGPSTVSIHFSYSDSQAYFTEHLDCKLEREKNIGTCTIEVAEGGPTATDTTSVVTTQSDLDSHMTAITITSGAELLSLPAETTVASSSATDSAAAPSSTESAGSNLSWNAMLVFAAAIAGSVLLL